VHRALQGTLSGRPASQKSFIGRITELPSLKLELADLEKRLPANITQRIPSYPSHIGYKLTRRMLILFPEKGNASPKCCQNYPKKTDTIHQKSYK
jgi:hypothetical protein